MNLFALGKNGKKEVGRNYIKSWEDIIIEPLKKYRFGKSAKGIICLLFCVSKPSFIGEEYFKDEFRIFILVCPDENRRIFPLKNEYDKYP